MNTYTLIILIVAITYICLCVLFPILFDYAYVLRCSMVLSILVLASAIVLAPCLMVMIGPVEGRAGFPDWRVFIALPLILSVWGAIFKRHDDHCWL